VPGIPCRGLALRLADQRSVEIQASRTAGSGRYEELSITAIMHSTQLCTVALVHSSKKPVITGFPGFKA
jgi:hypothetical protein